MRIAVIDSGIHPGHPHVGAVTASVHFTADGPGDDPVDRLGHGTAVAAAIREKAPAAELFAVKVFDRRLAAPIGALLRALEWCREHRMDVVNLSLGTANPEHREPLLEAVGQNGVVVSAAHMLPGTLPGVVAVDADETCPRDRFHYRHGLFWASPYPRPIPGVPPARNLHGVSFAVANLTGFVAMALETSSGRDVWTALRARAEEFAREGGGADVEGTEGAQAVVRQGGAARTPRKQEVAREEDLFREEDLSRAEGSAGAEDSARTDRHERAARRIAREGEPQ